MHLHIAISVLIAALAGAAQGAEKLAVVATLPSLGSIAREIAGPRAEVTVLARPQQDPHFIDPKPSFIVKLRDADLLIVNGLELEIGWAPPLIEGARNQRIMPGQTGHFDASSAITVIDQPTGPVDRAQGDVHGLGNPHYAIDPLALRAVAGALADRLTQIDPPGAAHYSARLKAYRARIDVAMFGAPVVEAIGGAKLAQEAERGTLAAFIADQGLTDSLGGWSRKLRSCQGRSVIGFHTNMNYFWRRFGITLAGTVEPRPGIPPSAGHVAQLVQSMRERKIGVIVTQPYYDDGAVKLIAGKTGARVVKLEMEGDDQLAVINRLVDGIAAALK